MKLFKTFSKTAAQVDHKWIIIDVANIPLGRAATFIAQRLTGKYNPDYTPHMDSGDNVVVINADQLSYAGNKLDKKYYRHSGFPGALKEVVAKDITQAEMLERAISGMLPKNKLRAERMARLRIYGDENHQHAAQKPEKVEVQ